MPLWPNNTNSQPKVSSPYGPRSGGYSSFHEGVDFVGYSNIVAVLAGLVTWAGPYNAAAGDAGCYKPDAVGSRAAGPRPLRPPSCRRCPPAPPRRPR